MPPSWPLAGLSPGTRAAGGPLFVWHGAEEKGLIGSRWFAENPTVPLEKIAAVLNADMIARNHPDSAAILGMLPPNRNSSELVESLLHPDYHTPGDEAELLDYEKLLRFTRWMYATGWRVAQSEQRPRIDEGWEYTR